MNNVKLRQTCRKEANLKWCLNWNEAIGGLASRLSDLPDLSDLPALLDLLAAQSIIDTQILKQPSNEAMFGCTGEVVLLEWWP